MSSTNLYFLTHQQATPAALSALYVCLTSTQTSCGRLFLPSSQLQPLFCFLFTSVTTSRLGQASRSAKPHTGLRLVLGAMYRVGKTLLCPPPPLWASFAYGRLLQRLHSVAIHSSKGSGLHLELVVSELAVVKVVMRVTSAKWTFLFFQDQGLPNAPTPPVTIRYSLVTWTWEGTSQDHN